MSDVAPDFGDIDPEDAWDDGDDFETKIAVLNRIVDDLRARRAEDEPRFEFRRQDALRLVAKLLVARERLDDIREALEAL